jgi:hypothetical protein
MTLNEASSATLQAKRLAAVSVFGHIRKFPRNLYVSVGCGVLMSECRALRRMA